MFNSINSDFAIFNGAHHSSLDAFLHVGNVLVYGVSVLFQFFPVEEMVIMLTRDYEKVDEGLLIDFIFSLANAIRGTKLEIKLPTRM